MLGASATTGDDEGAQICCSDAAPCLPMLPVQWATPEAPGESSNLQLICPWYMVRTTEVVVQSQHLDSFGHVNHATYFNYLEGARCDFMEQSGIEFTRFLDEGAFCVVLNAKIDYLAAARCGDRLTIYSWMEERAYRTFSWAFRITRNANNGGGLRKIVEARLRFVFINAEGKIIDIPPWFDVVLNDIEPPDH